jgi:hypothetical protein
MRGIYFWGPTSTLIIALASTPSGASCVKSNGVSMPSVVKAAARAFPAVISGATSSGGASDSKPISTPAFLTPNPMCGFPRLGIPGYPTSSCIQPALASAISIYSTRSTISGCARLTPVTNCEPENCLNSSAIRSICSGRSIRGALYLSNSRRASLAFRFASATRSFERRFNSPAHIPALRPERISPATPAAIPISAMMNRIASRLSRRYAHSTPVSKTNAATISHAHRVSRRACLSTSRSTSSSLAVIGLIFVNRHLCRPPPRRYRDRQFWIAIGLWVLYAIAMLYLLLCFKPHLQP